MFLGKKKDANAAWQSAGSETRRYPRMGIHTIVEVKTETAKVNCRLCDLSLGGLSFQSPWIFQPNDVLTIVLPPPEGVGGRSRTRLGATAVEARVCRSVRTMKPEGWQVGVRFANTSPDADALIRLWFMAFGEAAENLRAARAEEGKKAKPKEPGS
jgi:hypothetical protein